MTARRQSSPQFATKDPDIIGSFAALKRAA